MRFSIVVPVYNVEKYIGKCMDSLVNQSFRDYEIIIVDDESPDGSMEIIEAYRKKDPDRIRVVHQKNSRQGGARNHGAELALGEYLVFVDSDDYVSRGMLEILDRRLRETDCDILVFHHVDVDEDGNLLTQDDDIPLESGLYHPQTDREVALLPCGPVNKAFRREFYVGSGFRFPEKLLYEDTVTRILYAKAKSILITADQLYYYVQRENSSMTQDISEKMLDIVTMVELTLREFKRCGLYEAFREPLDVSLFYSLLCIEEKISAWDRKNPMQIEIADCIRRNFPDYKKNLYASPALIRALDYLTAHRFELYYWHCLQLNRLKERILRVPFFEKLNELKNKC